MSAQKRCKGSDISAHFTWAHTRPLEVAKLVLRAHANNQSSHFQWSGDFWGLVCSVARVVEHEGSNRSTIINSLFLLSLDIGCLFNAVQLINLIPPPSFLVVFFSARFLLWWCLPLNLLLSVHPLFQQPNWKTLSNLQGFGAGPVYMTFSNVPQQ